MLRYLISWLRGLEKRVFTWRVQNALKLHLRGEGRPDGLHLSNVRSRLELEWRAREIHPWDRALRATDPDAQFVSQAMRDTEAVVKRLFASLPHTDVIAIRVYEPASDSVIMSGEVLRSSLASPKPLSDRMWLGQLGISFQIIDNQFQPLG
jgi:hypothetical protein